MSPPRRRRVQLLYGNGGGGHKASANALQAALSIVAPDLQHVQLVDAAALSGAGPGDWLYNQLLSFNATTAIEMLHSAISVLMPLAKPTLCSVFQSHWNQTPDLAVVVSFVPMLNEIFAKTLPPHVKLFTVLTDFSHTPGHPWIQHPRQHLVTGTEIALAQALSAGYCLPDISTPSMTVTKTSGMVVHPKFYKPAFENNIQAKENIIANLGLYPSLPVVLVLFGGAPPTDLVSDIVTLLLNRPSPNQVNVIAVCSKNNQLYDRLLRRKKQKLLFQQRLHLTRFTKEIPLLMQISDVLIGKPGPGVVSEAFVSGLPSVLVTGSNGNHVMKQERDVLDWVKSKGIGKIAKRTTDAAVISNRQIAIMRNQIARLPKNRAVFELTDMVLQQLDYTSFIDKKTYDIQLTTKKTRTTTSNHNNEYNGLSNLISNNKPVPLSYQSYLNHHDIKSSCTESDTTSISEDDRSDSACSMTMDVNIRSNSFPISKRMNHEKSFSPTTITAIPLAKQTEDMEKDTITNNNRSALSLLAHSENIDKTMSRRRNHSEMS